jgi:hypothetical protein
MLLSNEVQRMNKESVEWGWKHVCLRQLYVKKMSMRLPWWQVAMTLSWWQVALNLTIEAGEPDTVMVAGGNEPDCWGWGA